MERPQSQMERPLSQMERPGLHNSSGFTLIDLMIGMALSMVLTMAVLQLFSITRQAYLTSTQFGELLENTNAAMTAIRNVAIRAGHEEPWTPIFGGCYKDSSPNTFLTKKGNMSLMNCKTQALAGNMVSFALQNGNGAPTSDCWIGNNVDPFKYGYLSDLSCKFTSGSNQIDGYYGGSSHGTNFYFGGGTGANAIYLLRAGIESTAGRALFSGLDGASNDSLYIYAQGEGDAATSTVRDCQGNRIGRDTRVTNRFVILTDATTGEPFLSCSVSATSASGTISRPAIKIASNVQAMRVLYAIDTDGDGAPNIYVKAAVANNYLNKVVGVQVALLMRTATAIAPVLDKKTYNLFSYTHGAYNDRFMRRQFNMTFLTLECVPSFSKECGGVLFSGSDWAGDTAVARIKAGDTIWFRQSPSFACPGGKTDSDKAGCTMSADGSMTALYHPHCGTDQTGTKENYMTKSTVSGTTVSCKAVE